MKSNSTAIEGRSSAPCSRSFGGYEDDDVGPEWDDSPQEPEKSKCGTTHYAGCSCHEQGWDNKWKAAIELAARATVERDMWKANHDNQVEIKRIIAARPDLKDRAPMVEKLMSERNRAQGWSTLQHERIKRLEAVIRELDAAHGILPENS